MSNRLQRFVDEHPEFFEERAGYRRLHADIRDLMDRYARAYDKAEYDRLKLRVEEARKQERERLQNEIDQWTAECAEAQQKADEIDLELQAISKKLKVSHSRIETAEEARKPIPVPQKSWYHSGAIFMLLALSGVTFIYLGIIFNERVSVSYLMSGIVCLVLGFYLQFGGSGVDPNRGDAVTMQLSIIKQEQGFVKIAKIQRATLMERRRINIQTVDTYKRKIHHSMANLNILNG